MAFRRRHHRVAEWRAFCDRHQLVLRDLDSLGSAFASADRFEELLTQGRVASREGVVELSQLSCEEFRALRAFVGHFKVDWQSWFVATLYPAYFAECERRGYLP
jgi:hypothetical protein